MNIRIKIFILILGILIGVPAGMYLYSEFFEKPNVYSIEKYKPKGNSNNNDIIYKK